MAKFSGVELTHHSQADQRGKRRRGRRGGDDFKPAIVNGNRIPPFTFRSFEIIQPEKAIRIPHRLIDRHGQTAISHGPTASLGDHTQGVGEIGLHQTFAGVERGIVMSIKNLGMFGKVLPSNRDEH